MSFYDWIKLFIDVDFPVGDLVTDLLRDREFDYASASDKDIQLHLKTLSYKHVQLIEPVEELISQYASRTT